MSLYSYLNKESIVINKLIAFTQAPKFATLMELLMKSDVITKNERLRFTSPNGATETAQDAAIQMDLLGHDFFVFVNEDTGRVSVVYRRKDGTDGLINANYRNPYEPVGEEVW